MQSVSRSSTRSVFQQIHLITSCQQITTTTEISVENVHAQLSLFTTENFLSPDSCQPKVTKDFLDKPNSLITSPELDSNPIQISCILKNTSEKEESTLLFDYLGYLIDSLVEIYYQPMALWIELKHSSCNPKQLLRLKKRLLEGYKLDQNFISLFFDILKEISLKGEEPQDEVTRLQQLEKISCFYAGTSQTDVARSIELQGHLETRKQEQKENYFSSLDIIRRLDLDGILQSEHIKTLVGIKKLEPAKGFAEHASLLIKEGTRLEKPVQEGLNSFTVDVNIYEQKSKALYLTAQRVSEQLFHVMNQMVEKSFKACKKTNDLKVIQQYMDRALSINNSISSMRLLVAKKCNSLMETIGSKMLLDINTKATNQKQIIAKFKEAQDKLLERNKQSYTKLAAMKDAQLARFVEDHANQIRVQKFNLKQKMHTKQVQHFLNKEE